LDAVTESLSRKSLTLSRTEVIAPVSGNITARNAQLGSIASAAGLPMFTIVRDGALELNADVSESDLTRLAVDQTAELTVVGATAPLAGAVRLVEPTIDAATRLGRARISFADSAAVREGMFVEAAILVAARDAIAVPVTAIGAFDGAATVMTITDGIAARVTVTTGIRMGGWIEVTSGLSGGETIVTKAGAFVRPGDHINPVQADTALNAPAN
jgi:HlyD family secretion protein